MKNSIFKLLFIVVFTFFLSEVKAQSFSTGVVDLNTAIGTTIELDIDTNTSLVTMTLSGPSDRWFGVGFGTSGMTSGADCVYISSGSLVDANIVGQSTPATDATNNWTVTSNMINGDTRTVVATRAIDTGDSNDYVFPTTEQGIMLIYANGSLDGSTSIGYHGNAASGNRGATVTNLTLGVDDVIANVQNNKTVVYPNPTNAEINLEFSSSFGNGYVNLYNSIGQNIYTEEVNALSNSVDISNFSKGVYVLEIVNERGQSETKRIAKN